jgi:hypothetical protein
VVGTREVIGHDIEVYRITYTTRDLDGVEVDASGVPDAVQSRKLLDHVREPIGVKTPRTSKAYETPTR